MLTVNDLLSRLAAGERMKEVASWVGVSETTLSRRLKAVGYAWDNSKKIWYYNSEGEEPLDLDLLLSVKSISHVFHTDANSSSHAVHTDVKNDSHAFHIEESQSINVSEHDVKSSSHAVHTDVNSVSHVVHINAKPDSHAVHMQFTPEQFLYLQQLADRRTRCEMHVILDLTERSFTLPEEDKERRTVMVYSSLGEAMDRLAERTRIEKSDLWAMALQDFLKKYDT